MNPTVAILSMGEMGAGVGRALVDAGARVVTSLEGRSAASAARAARAGVEVLPSDATLIAQSDFFLSIVPPAQAAPLAERLLPHLRRAPRKPVFANCNAIAPATVVQIAAPFLAEELPFVDAAIVGPPPAPGVVPPRFYVSGPAAARFQELRTFGLDVRLLSTQVGDAAAFKMSYAGVTKGLQALGVAMFPAAVRSGVSHALFLELQESQPDLLRFLQRQLPKVYSKAYRWVAEMEEIAAFLEPDHSSQIFTAAARLYRDVARDFAARADGDRIALLTEFLAQSTPQK